RRRPKERAGLRVQAGLQTTPARPPEAARRLMWTRVAWCGSLNLARIESSPVPFMKPTLSLSPGSNRDRPSDAKVIALDVIRLQQMKMLATRAGRLHRTIVDARVVTRPVNAR